MSAPSEAVLEKVGSWLRHGDQDLALARHALAMGANCPYDLVAYHAQQCAEKYLKAYLVYRLVDFPYTHNLLRLIELIPPDVPWIADVEPAAALSGYAVSARYPGEDEPVCEGEARGAIEIASGVCARLRQVLAASAVADGVEGIVGRMWPLSDKEWEDARRAQRE
jgi:HEPN domain-containing protein